MSGAAGDATDTTYQFGYGSPVNPPNISNNDFDNVLADCYLENESAQASTDGWTNFSFRVFLIFRLQEQAVPQ